MPQRNPGIDPLTFLNQGGSLGGLQQAMALSQALAPASSKPLVGKPGDIARDPTTWQILWQNPAEPEKKTPPEIIKLIEARDAFPVGHPNRAILDEAIKKASSHAPAATANSYGSPVPIMLPDGTIGYAQPGNREGAAPQIMRGEGGVPLTKPKDVPASMREKLAQNAVTLQKIDKALEMVETTPEAFGLQNMLPDAVTQRTDPAGVAARAMVSDIAGQKIHDRSGAAVSVGEAARLKPYVPNVSDTPETVKKKLTAFRNEYAAMQRELASGASLDQVTRSQAQPSGGEWGIRPLGGQ
jgi:hypothetical protein